MRTIQGIERRFKEVAGIEAELSVYPLPVSDGLQVRTCPDKSKSHGEVFTPLWLVDKMIESMDNAKKFDRVFSSLDLCAGYGQFSIRLIRKYMQVQGKKFDLELFFERHWFSELQNSSAYKLMYIFGKNINIAIGDAREIKKLPKNASGIYHFVDSKWVNKTSRFSKRDEDWFKKMYLRYER